MPSLADPPRGEVAFIYSPDVREFRLDHIFVEIVRAGFWEIDELVQSCKFSNCSHRHEPECVVREALQEKTLDELRYKNYLHLLAEAEAAVKN